MADRKPIQPAPDSGDGVTSYEVAQQLEALLGGEWVEWISTKRVSTGVSLWTQVEEQDGRRTITGILAIGENGLGTSDLRQIQIGQLENAVNLSRGNTPTEAPPAVADLPALERVDGQRPEDWSRLVAAHFTAWSAVGPNPAAAMARQTDTNRQTVNAWIREARLRGFLPPARRGKQVAMKTGGSTSAKPNPRSSVKPAKMPDSRTTRKKPPANE